MNTENFLPNIYLHRNIKLALLLQLVSKEQINILLLGDPYTGKTTMLQEMSKHKEKATFCSGIQFTRILTPTKVFTKEIMNETELLCVDDIDSCTSEDRVILKDILNSKMSVLASANPQFGRFDPYDLIQNQINMTPKTISSFDLIFPLKDLPYEENDRMLAGLMFRKKEIPPIELPKAHEVTIPPEIEKKMIEYYIENRSTQVDDFTVIKHVLRTFATVIKLTKANAILNGRPIASEEDFNVAVEIMEYCFHQITKDVNNGSTDIDRISSSRLTASERNNHTKVLDIINTLSGRHVAINDILAEGKTLGINPEEIEEILEKLRKAGIITEPRLGVIELDLWG